MCGCGGPMFNTGRHGDERSHHAHSEYEAIKHELKLMYARGDIDDQTYHRFKHLAKDGELGWDDLRRLGRDGTGVLPAREESTNLPSAERGTAPPRADTEMSLADWIRQRTDQLREAEEQSTALLGEVEAKAEELRASLDKMAENEDARSTDERQLRMEAERKLALQQQISLLEGRARELREDLQRIDSLRSQLTAREEEAKVED